MKCVIPEISWHNRDPVLSVDIQPLLNNSYRLATGGGDCHVLIWLLKVLENGAIDIDAVADLTRHQRAVNVVRWSNSGQYLASGDDDSNIILWQMKSDNVPLLDGNVNDKEVWVVLKVLRGHKEDIYDLCWSPDDSKLLSGSIDNTAIIWDFSKGKIDKILTDHKGFVQGVSWDPKNEFISTASSDRICRVFDHTGKHLKCRTGKGALPVPEDHPLFGKQVKYFHDDTFKSYFRRLKFSPDGSVLVVPAGCVETDDCKKALNATFVFTLDDLKDPVAVLPSGKQCSVCVGFCPILFELRADGPDPLISLPYRMVFAVATDTDVIIYDTQQTKPIAYLQKIHYTRLTDISWSKDGLLLAASSTDGFCTVVNFEKNELGVEYKKVEEIQEVIKETPVESKQQEEVAIESKPEAKKRPTILDQWTIKTPKRKLETDNENIKSPSPVVNKLTPKRIKPIPVEDQTKTPTTTVKKKSTDTPPKKKGTILNFVITGENRKNPELVADEEARDAWKCENEVTAKKQEIECVDLTEDSIEDFKLEISQSLDVNESETTTNDVQAKTDKSETLNNSKEITSNSKIIKKNDKNTPEAVSNSKEITTDSKKNETTDKENEKTNPSSIKPPQPQIKKARRVELITLSSPRSKKKGSNKKTD